MAVHAVVLGLLGLRAVRLNDWTGPRDTVVLIDVTPRPLLSGERPRQPTYAAPTSEARVETLRDAAPGLPRDEDEEDEDEGLPAPRLPVPPGGPAAAASGIDEAWRVPTAPTGRQLGRALRGSALGCDVMNGRLSAGEQAQCDEAFNRAAGAAAPIAGSGDAARDGRFAAQGARNLQAYEARRRPLGGGTGTGQHGDCPGSNFGAGCPGAHLDPGWRRDNDDVMRGAQGGRQR